MHNRRNGFAAGVSVLVIALTSNLRAQERRSGQANVRPATAKEIEESAAKRGTPSKNASSPDRSGASPEKKSPQTGDDTGRTRLESPKSGGDPEPRSAVVQEPSQGRPIFITPGETFYFVMRMPSDVSGDVSFSLRHAMEGEVRIPLKPATPPSYNDQYCSLVLMVPQAAEPGLYDLEVKTGRSAYLSRRCVKVVDAFKTKFRFVQLSNMNIGDLTAPDFDEMLPREINILAPEFIIATGDYTEWAKARDDASSWTRVLTFMEQFNAPVFMLCGAHDHEASFTRMVATKPVDKIDYGAYHGLLLLDHPGNPIYQDAGQIQWLENDLKHSRQKKLTFIAAHSDELALLDLWRENGNLAAFIDEHKIKLFITGGSTDWDFKEFAGKLKDAGGLQFVRTHQSSTALRDKASGISHYRVFDVDGDQVSYVYPDDNATEKMQYSIPTGRLRAYYDNSNDGTASRVTVTVLNALNQAFADAHVWLRVAKGRGDDRPSVAPGRLVRTLDCGKYWACDVSLDLPDKGAVRLMASTDPEAIPPAVPVEMALEGPREWSFTARQTDFGLAYSTSDAQVALKLTNKGKRELTCWPVIRVNGAEIYPDRKACPRLPITLEAGKTVSIPLVLDLRRVSPGRHALQAYFLEDPLARLQTVDVTLH